jgi:NADP-dependent 3-hydroxy acid dehydrogenase YdfG
MPKLDNKGGRCYEGNSGIGLAAAKELKANGAHIAISGRNKQTLAEAAEQLGSDTLAMAVDVAQPSELERFFAQVKDRFGKVDILFVNAGVAESSSMAAVIDSVAWSEVRIESANSLVESQLLWLRQVRSITATATIECSSRIRSRSGVLSR